MFQAREVLGSLRLGGRGSADPTGPALVCPPLAPVSLSHPPCPRSLNTGAENALMDFSQSLKIFFS